MLSARPLLACFLALACATPAVRALDAGQAIGPGSAYGDERYVAMRLSATGTVTAVDARTRLMAVQAPRGAITFRLDPMVPNAHAIRVGQQVQVDYVAAFLLSPRRDNDEASEWGDPVAGARPVSRVETLATSYARPVTFVADVVSLDKDNLVVWLRAPGGDVAAYPVQDRSALAGMRTGEQVHVAMNQAVAVGVTPVRR